MSAHAVVAIVQGTGITSDVTMNGVGHMHPGLPPVWQSNRPPMHECSEEAFLADLAAFLRVRLNPGGCIQWALV